MTRPGERARDQKRKQGGPRYGGQQWAIADKRGDDRFGIARSDSADRMTDEPDTRVETGGERTGLARAHRPTGRGRRAGGR